MPAGHRTWLQGVHALLLLARRGDRRDRRPFLAVERSVDHDLSVEVAHGWASRPATSVVAESCAHWLARSIAAPGVSCPGDELPPAVRLLAIRPAGTEPIADGRAHARSSAVERERT